VASEDSVTHCWAKQPARIVVTDRWHGCFQHERGIGDFVESQSRRQPMTRVPIRNCRLVLRAAENDADSSIPWQLISLETAQSMGSHGRWSARRWR